MTAPTNDGTKLACEALLAAGFLWEVAEGFRDESDAARMRRIAGLIDRQREEIERLRQAVERRAA